MKKVFNIHFVFTLLFVMPLLLANIYYIDDNGRASAGYTNWGQDGRPLADTVMKFIFMSSHLADIFPLPLIISVAVLSLTLAYYQRLHFSHSSEWVGVLATFAFFANPYLAEVFSYRFDVLTLSLALTMSIAWIFLPERTGMKRLIYGVTAIIAVYCLYQIAVNITVMMALVMAFRGMVKNERPGKIISLLAQRALEVVLASIIYLKIILPMTFSGDHPANHPAITDNSLFVTLSTNLMAYWNFINATFYKSNQGMGVLLIVLGCAVVAAICIAVNYVKSERDSKRLALGIIAPFIPFVAILMIPGSLLMLSNPLLVPRAMLGISGFMLFSATLIAWAACGRWRAMNIIIAVPLLYSLTSIYVYGNAIRQQDAINTTVVNRLKTDTADLSNQHLYMQFIGLSPRSVIYTNSVRNYPVLSVLIPEYFANWWFPFPYMSIKGYDTANPLKDHVAVTADEIAESLCKGERIAHHQDYDLFKYRDRLTVDFKKNGCAH